MYAGTNGGYKVFYTLNNGDSVVDELKNLKNLKLPKEKIKVSKQEQEPAQHDTIEDSDPEDIVSEGDLTIDSEEDSD